MNYVFIVALNLSTDAACLVQSEVWWSFFFFPLVETMLIITRSLMYLVSAAINIDDRSNLSSVPTNLDASAFHVTWDRCQCCSPWDYPACLESCLNQYPVPTQTLNQTCLDFRALACNMALTVQQRVHEGAMFSTDSKERCKCYATFLMGRRF